MTPYIELNDILRRMKFLNIFYIGALARICMASSRVGYMRMRACDIHRFAAIDSATSRVIIMIVMYRILTGKFRNYQDIGLTLFVMHENKVSLYSIYSTIKINKPLKKRYTYKYNLRQMSLK